MTMTANYTYCFGLPPGEPTVLYLLLVLMLISYLFSIAKEGQYSSFPPRLPFRSFSLILKSQ